MPRAPDALVRPSPEMTSPRTNNTNATATAVAVAATAATTTFQSQLNHTAAGPPEHKPFLFTYELSTSTTLNYDAYRTAKRISEMVLALLGTMEGLRLKDIAITRYGGGGVVILTSH